MWEIRALSGTPETHILPGNAASVSDTKTNIGRYREEKIDGAPGENRTPTHKVKQILSLPRLPIPPQGQQGA